MKRRIIYIIGSLNVGGAERHLVQVATRLKQRGWDPEVYALWPDGPLASTLGDANITVHNIELSKRLAAVIRSERLRKRIGYLVSVLILFVTLWRRRSDIVHFFLPGAYIIGGIVSLLTMVPTRIMSRRSLNTYQQGHRFSARLEHFLHPRMTLICGNSQAVIAQLREEGIEPARLRLIYNGIDTESFETPFDICEARSRLGIAPAATVFIIVANLIPYKGHADLIAAFAMIKSNLKTPWALLCIGRDDGIAAQLQSQVNEAGLQENVQFLGSRSDVPDLLRMSDIGILCSHQEGFSNAILECMAAGLPMVVTDVGGNSEAVIDEETGHVVPPHDPAALGRALLGMAENSSRKAMGKAGQERVRRLFSMEACIDGYEALYHDARSAVPE